MEKQRKTIQINPALSAVVSTFANFVPTPHISSYTYDAMKTTPLLNKTANNYIQLAPITKISFRPLFCRHAIKLL